MFKRSPKNSRKLTAKPTRAKRFRAKAQRQQVARRRPAAKEPGHMLPALGRAAASAGLRLALFLGVGLLLVGGWAALADSPLAGVRSARVTGTAQLSRLDVLSAAGVGSDTSLMRLNVNRARHALLELPWVKEAQVERGFGGKVTLAVEEHRAEALALVDGRFLFLDAELNPFAALDGAAPPDLVVISGLSRAEWLGPDDEVARLKTLAAELLAALPPSAVGTGGGLSEIHLDRVWGLSVVVGDTPATVRLGFTSPARRLALLETVLGDLKARGEIDRARLIDLGDDRRVVVRLWRKAA